MRFEGILPAVTTPFDDSDQIDVDALKANVEAMLEAGVHGFVATGTMGEAAGLSREERRTVVRAVVEQTGGRGPVVAGVSSGSARQSLEYARDAKEAGVDAIMSLPPLGYRADPDEVIAFFTELATIGLPIMAYNNPEASGVDMPPAMIVRIAQEVEGRRGHQGVLGRRAPAGRAAQRRLRPGGPGGRGRLGARGLLRRGDRLGDRRRRRGAARGRRAL